ncbi:hypothetical protein [Aureibacter tunicatorum]|uniref:Uncharacterized protein n=1 Tax=Aureibacter tunicatorum TaxID=866807 RepID=A0AAE3XME8_9BACT|nr:hypothetical protein [Aureibacter tunicatorum]MDR6238456.1 hypothetical protein [Aureibacter tunicatorum]BDD05610.1 hypothetical protein AUTU_30930 [Aureibacter tunicatorum]
MYESRQPFQKKKRTSSSQAKGVVQRAVGFEVEVKNWRTWKPRDDQSFFEGLLRRGISYRKPHNARDVLMKSKGYELTADRPSSESVPEFVTDAFQETDDGEQKLQRTFQSIVELVDHMHQDAQKHPNSLNDLRHYEYAGDLRKPFTMIDAENVPDLHPQATVGVHLTKMSNLMEISGNHSPSQKAHSRFTRIADVHDPPAYQEKDSMTSAFPKALKALESFKKKHISEPNWEPSEELKNLFAYMIHYLECPMVNFQSYPKSYFPIMARTDFAMTFKLMPPEEVFMFSENDGELFVKLFEHVNFSPPCGTKMEMHQQVFQKGIRQGQPTASCHEINGLNRAAWVRNIALGRDMMTQDDYPGKRNQGRQFETMGAWYKYDRLGDWRIPAPVLELRRIQFTRDIKELPLIAHDVFNTIRELNKEPSQWIR